MTASNAPPQWCIDTIMAFRKPDAQSPDLIAGLARRLAESGEILEADHGAADVASTGGPASLTTFVPPLILAAGGIRVPKVGVPGRPAGVVDTLGVVPNYKTALSVAEFRGAIRESNFGNTLSTGDFAPDDGVLFRSRQLLDAQTVPSLVIASLLSKKLAAGLRRVVFDVRTMRGGNFGESVSEAQANVELMQEAGAALGITVSCVVTDGQTPAQPMVGRAESLRGLLSLLERKASPWLERHFQSCVALANVAIGDTYGKEPDRERMRATLDLHLRSQGSAGLSAAEEYLVEVERRHVTSLFCAPAKGRLSWNMDLLRSAVVANQGTRTDTSSGGFPDAGGIELLQETGSHVDYGAPIAIVRGITPKVLRRISRALESAVCVTDARLLGDEDGKTI